MKKLFTLIVAACAMLGASMLNTSCQPYEHGFIMYRVDIGSIDDAHLYLGNAIGYGLAEAGLEQISAYQWKLDGEKNAMNKLAANAFTNRCKTIDKDRTLLGDPSMPLKGKTVKLHFDFGTADEGDCATYTFKEADK